MTALAEHFDEQARRLNLVQPISGTEVSAAGQEVAK